MKTPISDALAKITFEAESIRKSFDAFAVRVRAVEHVIAEIEEGVAALAKRYSEPEGRKTYAGARQ